MSEKNHFVAGITPPEKQRQPAWWFVIQGDKLLVCPGSGGLTVPCLDAFEDLALPLLRRHYLGHLNHHPCCAVEVGDDTPPPQGMAFEGLRQVHGRIDDDLFWVATRAVQIVDWDRTHQFCGRCGSPVHPQASERAKLCPRCGLLHFPRLAPAIIVRVERGDQLLLARSRHFAPGLYSVIAGFVEPGETLEEAVVREVREEVGIAIRKIEYFGSQPWPFPHSLMIGFTAQYDSGEISLADPEIEDAGWFTAAKLPLLPGKISIARKLIDAFLDSPPGGPDPIILEG